MNVFAQIRKRENRLVLRQVNTYLNFSARIAEAKERISFINKCIESNQYPRQYWKAINRSRIRPNHRTLRRYALCQIDTLRLQVTELERNLSQRQHAVDNLPRDLQSLFESYTLDVCRRRAEKIRKELNLSLCKSTPQSEFPDRPERYVHNLSNLNLSKTLVEALSLGLKFCDTQNSDNQLATETEFENLMNQLHDFSPTSAENVRILKATLVDSCLTYRRTETSG